MKRTVTLVNKQGDAIGTSEIIAAHTGEGKLHRAFSVYLFRHDGQEILIQQRSAVKMLWPLIWANTCCSHPLENEEPIVAGMRRLQEELGIACPLIVGPTFVYRALDPADRGVEHEHVTILTGDYDGEVQPNPEEVAAWKWIGVEELKKDMQTHPDLYAPWFHRGLHLLLKTLH